MKPILVFDPFVHTVTPLTAVTLMPRVAEWAAPHVDTCAIYYDGGFEIDEPKLRGWLARVPDYIELGCIDHEQREGPILNWLNEKSTVEERRAAARMVRQYMEICKDVRPDIKWGVWGVPRTHQQRRMEVINALDWFSPPVYDKHLVAGPSGAWTEDAQKSVVAEEVGAAYGLAQVFDKLCIPCVRMRIGPSSSQFQEVMELIPIPEFFNETIGPCHKIGIKRFVIWGKVRRTYEQGTLQMYCPEEYPWGNFENDMAHLEYEQARRLQVFILVMGGGYVSHSFENPTGDLA